MASDRPEQNDAEQDEENGEQNDLEEIADLKIQGNTFLIDSLHVSNSAQVSLSLDDTKHETIETYFTFKRTELN